MSNHSELSNHKVEENLLAAQQKHFREFGRDNGRETLIRRVGRVKCPTPVTRNLIKCALNIKIDPQIDFQTTSDRIEGEKKLRESEYDSSSVVFFVCDGDPILLTSSFILTQHNTHESFLLAGAKAAL